MTGSVQSSAAMHAQHKRKSAHLVRQAAHALLRRGVDAAGVAAARRRRVAAVRLRRAAVARRLGGVAVAGSGRRQVGHEGLEAGGRLLQARVQDGRVPQPQAVVQLVVDKLGLGMGAGG